MSENEEEAASDSSQELISTVTKLLADALKASLPGITAQVANAVTTSTTAPERAKIPAFTIEQFSSSSGSTVRDYFKRFKWALGLSKISVDQHATFARVYMGTELNNALKFLISPIDPETYTFEQIENTLIAHFDISKNQYAESVKFRQIVRQDGESLANFALKLKQGAAYCEYGTFLDRMLIEQLLHGYNDREVCDEIISKKPATFKDAYEIAHALESTRHTTDAVKYNTCNSPVEKTKKYDNSSQRFIEYI